MISRPTKRPNAGDLGSCFIKTAPELPLRAFVSEIPAAAAIADVLQLNEDAVRVRVAKIVAVGVVIPRLAGDQGGALCNHPRQAPIRAVVRVGGPHAIRVPKNRMCWFAAAGDVGTDRIMSTSKFETV